MGIKFEIPLETEEFVKKQAKANADLPLAAFDSRSFEKLVYWIYKQEIEEGNWKGLYSEIRLMSGVRDGGKDCALFNNADFVGVIQCKHSLKDAALSMPLFTKEIIKFGLYYLTGIVEIIDPLNFTYYIASSSGFTEDCQNLIGKFNILIENLNHFDNWTNTVITANASLSKIDTKDLKNKLISFLKSIKIIKIDIEDINLLLSKSNQILTINRFFELKHVIDIAALENVAADIKKVVKETAIKPLWVSPSKILSQFEDVSTFLTNWNSYIDVNKTIHFERSQIKDIKDWILSPLETNKNPIVLVVGDAGTGKTVVMKELYTQLHDANIPVLGLKSDIWNAETIEDLEKKLDFRAPLLDMIETLLEENDKVVILVDQIDALSQSLSVKKSLINTYLLLIKKLSNLEGVRIIISVRRFDLEYDQYLRGLDQNKIFDINELNVSEVELALEKLSINFGGIKPRLREILRIPHNLYVFCSIYHKNLSIDGLNETHDLYHELWKQKITKSPESLNLAANALKNIVYKVAQKMNELQVITLDKDIFEVNYLEIDYLVSSNILVLKGSQIQFFHQSFYDYVFARNFVEQKKSLSDFIIRSKQVLHIRLTIKVILTYLRETDHFEYLYQIKKLLKSNRIKFHVKLLVLNTMGYNSNPQLEEMIFVKNNIINNKRLIIYFIESIIGDKWIEFAIKEGIFDCQLYPKSTLSNKFNRWKTKRNLSNHPIQNNHINSTVLEIIYGCLYKSITEARARICVYLSEKKDFDGLIWIVKQMLYSLKIWDSPVIFSLYEKYRETIQKDVFIFVQVLENIIPFNMDYVCKEFFEFTQIRNLQSSDESNHNDLFHLNDLFDKILISDINKGVTLGFAILKDQIVSYTLKYKIDTTIIYNDNLYNFYDHDRSTNHGSQEEIYSLVIRAIEEFAKNEDQRFKQLVADSMSENSLSILLIVVFGFLSNPIPYYDAIVEFISTLESKKGFEREGKLNYWIRILISKIYPNLEQGQKDVINAIILSINCDNELTVFERDGKKTHNLRWYGYKKFQYLSSIPMQSILNQKALRKYFLELSRKFQPINNEIEPNKVYFHKTLPPLQPTAYENMNLEQWEKSFIKLSDYEDNFQKGGIFEHSRSFSDSVKKNPTKYISFIESLISNKKISSDYWYCGINALNEIKYDPRVILKLFKIAINTDLEKSYKLYLIWMVDTFIAAKIIDDDIFNFLIDALFSKTNKKASELSTDPIMEGANSIQGASLQRLIKCIYEVQYCEKIFNACEEISLSGNISTKAILLLNLVYLIKINSTRTLKILLNTNSQIEPSLIKPSIIPLQYLIHNDYKSSLQYIEKCLPYKNEEIELTYLLTEAFIHNYKGSKSLLFEMHKSSEIAKAASIRVASENIFNNDLGIRAKSMFLFKRYLNDKSLRVSREYDLVFFKNKEDFTEWIPFLNSYAKSRSLKNNPRNFLAFLLANVNNFPEKCIDLMTNYRSMNQPNLSQGPYYTDEPLKIVLNAYIVFNNSNNEKYIKKAIKLFDQMLQIDFLRKNAYMALDIVEK